MVNSTIVFRVEGTRQTGLGHFFRCLALADAFRKSNFKIFFLWSVETEMQCKENLEKNGFQSRFLEDSGIAVGSAAEALTTASILREMNCDFLMIDGYQFDEEYQLQIKSEKILFGIFDDFHYANNFHADVILNQNFFVKKNFYSNNSELLLGARYAILRDEFLSIDSVKKNNSSQSIIICLGGSDKNNFTLNILEALVDIESIDSFHLNIVLGPANVHKESISLFCEEFFQKNSTIHHPCNEMGKLMSNSTYGIFAGGTSVYEVMYLGLPCVLVEIADNQKLNLNWIENNTQYPTLRIDHADFKSSLKEIFLKLVENWEQSSVDQLVDGHGKYRIVKAITELINLKR